MTVIIFIVSIFLKGCDSVKLERINENQIRCTLDSTDFHMRKMDLQELSYGSPKARALFRELMKRAEEELDFSAENMPIMIEATPLSEDSISLVVTRVEDPEEFDTRFARFAPSNIIGLDSDDSEEDALSETNFGHHNSFLSLFQKLTQEIRDNEEDDESYGDDDEYDNDYTSDTPSENNASNQSSNLVRGYCFASLDEICHVAQIIAPIYSGVNSVYKNVQSKEYILVLYQSHHTQNEFNIVCNQISEYGNVLRGGAKAIAYCEEHLTMISKDHALQVLCNL